MNTTADIFQTLEQRLSLFGQANLCLPGENPEITLSVLDIIEMIRITRDEVAEQLRTEPIELGTGRTIRAGGFNKYQKDPDFHDFWNDVEKAVREMIQQTFLREIVLSGKEKMATHPMATKFGPVVVAPIFQYFLTTHPENILVGGKKFFDEVERIASEVEFSTHADDVRVARKMLVSMTKSKKQMSPSQRLRVIKKAAQKLALVNTIEDTDDDGVEFEEHFDDETFGFDGEAGLGC